MAGRPYAAEELLSFGRLRRAVTKRVVEMAESALNAGTPFDQAKLAGLTAQEWKAAKEAARSSPAARQAAHEHMLRIVGSMVDQKVKDEKGELEALGVEDRTI